MPIGIGLGTALAGLATGGAGLAGGLLAGRRGRGLARRNFRLQKQAFEWQKSMQERAWAREDSAVQRRVADLRKAGISPVLAGGQGAQSSAPVKLQAPQKQNLQFTNMMGAMQSISQLAGSMASVAQTLADAALSTSKRKTEDATRDPTVRKMKVEARLAEHLEPLREKIGGHEESLAFWKRQMAQWDAARAQSRAKNVANQMYYNGELWEIEREVMAALREEGLYVDAERAKLKARLMTLAMGEFIAENFGLGPEAAAIIERLIRDGWVSTLIRGTLGK